jgi:6-phosphofructokinase 2
MSVIVTLTMNPALDIHTAVPHVRPTDKLRCSAVRYDAGGGGINVARAVRSLGGTARAIVTTGGDTGARLLSLMARDAIPVEAIPIDGSTRESFTVTDDTTDQQYRFVLPGPTLRPADEARCLATVNAAAPYEGYLVVSGSLPPGCSDQFFARVEEVATRHRCRLVVDTSGPALARVNGAYLIKPSIRELRDCARSSLLDRGSQIAAARELIRAHTSEVVLVSLGASGALLVTEDEAIAVPGSVVRAGSGVGAGDNMVAATTLALDQGWDLVDAVKLGVSAGAAATLTPGSQPCARRDVDRLYSSASPSSGQRLASL